MGFNSAFEGLMWFALTALPFQTLRSFFSFVHSAEFTRNIRTCPHEAWLRRLIFLHLPPYVFLLYYNAVFDSFFCLFYVIVFPSIIICSHVTACPAIVSFP
jgi:putative effector of murein hydrolase LrgA (UPF0299 family)